MSDSPENKKPSNNTPSAAPSASLAPSQPAKTPQGKSAEFKTENIGNWAAHQEGYFAEQNRKSEEQRKKAEQTRKKVLPIVFIIGGFIVAGLIIWGIVALVLALTAKPEAPEVPTISGGTSEDINNYRDFLQDFFNKNDGNLSAVEDAVNDTLDTDNGKEYADQVKLAEIFLLESNSYYSEALSKAQGINIDKLDLSQKISYYGVLYYCNTLLGNTEAANEYLKIQYDLSQEQGGEGGGGGA